MGDEGPARGRGVMGENTITPSLSTNYLQPNMGSDRPPDGRFEMRRSFPVRLEAGPYPQRQCVMLGVSVSEFSEIA